VLTLLHTALASPTFYGYNLIVQRAEIQTHGFPCIKVIGNRDCTTGPLGASDGDILVECRCALNRRLIHTSILPDRVARPVTGDGAFLRAAGGKAEVIFYDVILDKRVGAPAIDRKQASPAANTKVATEVDGARTGRVSNNII
jgi:hypothetical protein